jgi:cell division protein FtsA
LVMNSIENKTQSAVKMQANVTPEKVTYNREPVVEIKEEEEFVQPVNVLQSVSVKEESTENKIRRSFFDKYVDKIKDFLDNAE